MISLSIDRTSISDLPLTLSDNGSGTYVIVAWQPGARSRDNVIAKSRWTDGGQLVSTKTDIVTMDLVVRVNGTSLANMRQEADTLADAFNQYAYTITETVEGELTARTYACLPASFEMASVGTEWQHSMTTVSFSIPRQP